MSAPLQFQGNIPLAAKEELGSLGVLHLKRFWSRRMATHDGGASKNQVDADWVADNTLLSGLRIGLRETLNYIYCNRPTLDRFEAWILEKNGGMIDTRRLQLLNAALSGRGLPIGSARTSDESESVLTSADLNFWKENGYVVVHNAVSSEQCQAAAQAIYDFLGMDPEQPDTWYGTANREGIWVPLLHHPAFWANRDSPRIHRVFSQLWDREDLWVTVDQGGMNPPERPGWSFPGQGLHFDVSLELPIPFGVQGILYLTDTTANQGAFKCVPGFHRVIETWLKSLPDEIDPRNEDLEKFGPVPIPGLAGDLIIWHHALPHSSSPNRAARPRVVQYIRLQPSEWDYNPRWR
ncbi:MAG: phytanoyl-CoA dioxygenase family protein [Candidatus Sulfotelmatobacter sp.]